MYPEVWVQHRKAHDKSRTAPKLSEEQKIHICQWIAQWVPIGEIRKRVKEQFGVTVWYAAITHLKDATRWQPAINRFRSEYVAGIMQEPIAHKRVRIQELTKLMEQAAKDPKTSAWRRRAEIASYLEKARLEMDEKKTDVTNLYLTQINEYTDEQLLARREELLTKIKQWRLPNAIRDGREESQEAGGAVAEAPGNSAEPTEHPSGS